jgi:hypothetical protein
LFFLNHVFVCLKTKNNFFFRLLPSSSLGKKQSQLFEMDANALTVIRQNNTKEQRFQAKWDAENNRLNKDADLFADEVGLPPLKSAAIHFLEQTNSLQGNPYDIRGKKKPSFSTQDLLYTGVSKEGEGRHAYLLNRSYEDPQSKYSAPCRESHEIGWASAKITSAPSTFSRKPLVQDTFYRNNGIPLKMDSEEH